MNLLDVLSHKPPVHLRPQMFLIEEEKKKKRITTIKFKSIDIFATLTKYEREHLLLLTKYPVPDNECATIIFVNAVRISTYNKNQL